MRGIIKFALFIILFNPLIAKAIEIKEICLTSPREIEIFTGVSLANEKFNIEICYPKITDKRIHTRDIINRYIYNTVKRIAENEVSFLNENYQSLTNDEKNLIGNNFEFKLDYKIGFASNNFFSGYIQSYVYTGGAHGVFGYEYINFDVKKNKNLKFSDIFKEGSIGTVREMVLKVGKDRIYEQEDFLESKEPLSFYVDKRGNFIFTLAPYEYGPFSAGFREFHILYQNLEPFIREDSVVYKILFRR